MTDITLFCLVHGDSPADHAFPVKISPARTIGELKRIIKSAHTALQQYHENDIILWRVSITEDDLAAFDPYFDFKTRGTKLTCLDEVQDHFLNAPRNHLHIIVEKPPSLWIRYENQQMPTKWPVANWLQDLDQFASNLCQVNPLRKLVVRPDDVTFFGTNNIEQPLRRGTILHELGATYNSPLIVRFPFSNNSILARCNLSNFWVQLQFAHTTGGWYELKKAVERKFEEIQGAAYWFVDNNEGYEIYDELQFNDWLNEVQVKNGRYNISVRVEIQGKKCYSDWKLDEITKVITGISVDGIGELTKITLNDLPKYTGDISKDIIDGLAIELQVKLAAFKSLSNESVVREFVSSFMTRSVQIMQKKYPDLLLKAREKLMGTRGYGPIDYCVKMNDIVTLVTEAKNENFTQGAAQNIAQIHSAVEDLEKKRKVTDDDVHRVVMYGIVTSGSEWMFIRWTGKSKNPTIQLTPKVQCSFDLTSTNKILIHITGILENQLESLDNPNKRITGFGASLI